MIFRVPLREAADSEPMARQLNELAAGLESYLNRCVFVPENADIARELGLPVEDVPDLLNGVRWV